MKLEFRKDAIYLAKNVELRKKIIIRNYITINLPSTSERARINSYFWRFYARALLFSRSRSPARISTNSIFIFCGKWKWSKNRLIFVRTTTFVWIFFFAFLLASSCVRRRKSGKTEKIRILASVEYYFVDMESENSILKMFQFLHEAESIVFWRWIDWIEKTPLCSLLDNIYDSYAQSKFAFMYVR